MILWVSKPIGAYRGLLQLKVQELLLWAILWFAVAAILTLRIPARDRVVAAPSAPAWLSVVHGSVATGLILLFLGWHMANHLSALLGSNVQHNIMLLLRRWYRSAFVQPVLIAGFLFMIGSALFLARRATVTRTDGLGTIQTLTGAYLAAFLLSHLTSTFSARFHGVRHRLGFGRPPRQRGWSRDTSDSFRIMCWGLPAWAPTWAVAFGSCCSSTAFPSL